MTVLERLYKKTKTGKVQICDIQIIGSEVVTTFGELGGAMQEVRYTCNGKNLGKTNETTASQQAILEAKSKWDKKIKSGYTLTVDCDTNVQTPAKVKIYQDQIKNVKFPCISTPKLNGVNGLYRRENGELILYSRGGEIYPEIPHLTKLIHTAMDYLKCNELNGELYIHGEHLQDIQSAVKKPNTLSPKLTFHIFDIPDNGAQYIVRRDVLLSMPSFSIEVQTLTGTTCNSHEELEIDYNKTMAMGYEGTVIYNQHHMYKYNERSSDAFKYKKAIDAEFQIIGYELDRQGNPTIICQSEGGPFKVRPTGTAEYRKQLLLDMPNNIGKFYKVEYETLSKDKIPLKPVGICIRDCDQNGQPLE